MQEFKLEDILQKHLSEERFRRFCLALEQKERLLYWQEKELKSLCDLGYSVPLDFIKVKEQLADSIKLTKETPVELRNPLNLEVLEKLKGASCHSDIIEPIKIHLDLFNDVKSFCPNGKNYSYIFWYVNNVIFAYATGMKNVTIRLSQKGGLKLNELSKPQSFKIESGWFSIPYDSPELGILVEKSYKSAKIS